MPPQASPALVPGPQTLRSGEARANPGADPVRWEELGGWSRAVARTLGRGRMSQRRAGNAAAMVPRTFSSRTQNRLRPCIC